MHQYFFHFFLVGRKLLNVEQLQVLQVNVHQKHTDENCRPHFLRKNKGNRRSSEFVLDLKALLVDARLEIVAEESFWFYFLSRELLDGGGGEESEHGEVGNSAIALVGVFTHPQLVKQAGNFDILKQRLIFKVSDELESGSIEEVVVHEN